MILIVHGLAHHNRTSSVKRVHLVVIDDLQLGRHCFVVST
jgi:hypothetical protein